MKDLSNENIIHIKNNDIEYIQFKRLLEYSDILTHCFTLRNLDFAGFDSYDKNKNKVEQSYQKICNEFNIKYSNLCRPKQTHTNIVKDMLDGDEGIYNEKFYDVDGLITNKKEKALILAFADCTPLLFFDPIKNVIANIHSGWRGTVQMIGEKAVEKMISSYKCNPSDIICCIGPTIRKCHFEVEQNVRDIFYSQFKGKININKYITVKEDNQNRYYIDIVEINKEILLKLGLKDENIIDSKICSVCHEEKIHSHRAHGKNAGRNISIIELTV